MSVDYQSTDESGDSELIPPPQTDPVRDRFNLVYFIVLFTGIATLIPWNFFVTAKHYFDFKLRNTSLPDGADYSDPNLMLPNQLMFENYAAFCAMGPNIIFITLNMLITKYVPAFTRFALGIIIMGLVFTLTLVLVDIDTDKIQPQFFMITMLSVVVINSGSAFVQGSLFGIAAMLPRRNMKAAMEGQAVGGVLAAVANIITLSIANSSPTTSAFAYFSIALGCIVLSGVFFCLLPKLNFSKYYFQRRLSLSGPIPVRKKTDLRNASVSSTDDEARVLLLHSALDDEPASGHIIPVLTESQDILGEELNSTSLPVGPKSLPRLFAQLWIPGTAVLIVFCVTLSLFPAVLSRIVPVRRHEVKHPDLWTHTYFIPVICFLNFNFFDWLGRFLGGTLRWPSSRHRVLIFFLSLLRIGFIPLAVLCNVRPRYHLPVIFEHDAWSGVLVALIGLTNGYLGTLCMMYGPGYAEPVDQENAGTIMSFFLTLGLTIGVSLSFVFPQII